MSSSADNHLADTASETYERELDEGLEEDAQGQLREVEAALKRLEDGHVRHLQRLREGDPGRAARGRPLDDALHRRREEAGPVTEPAWRDRPQAARRPRRLVDERAAADLRRGAAARRRGEPVARPRRDRRRRRLRRPADEAGRREDARARRGGPDRRPVLDPSRPQLRHRVRALLERHVDRDRADRARGALDARLLRALGRAASRAAGRARLRARRQRRRTSSTASGSAT